MSPCSGLDPALQSVLFAKESALRMEIGVAVVGKQLAAIEQQAAAVHALLADAAQLSKSLTTGQTFDAQG